MAPVRGCRDTPATKVTSNTQACQAQARVYPAIWLTDTGCPTRVCRDPGDIHPEARGCPDLVTSPCVILIIRRWKCSIGA